MSGRLTSVFGADEQSDVAVDVQRWIGLAALVLEEERAPDDAELALIFVAEDAIADLNARFLGHAGATDVLAFPIDGDVTAAGRRPDAGGRGPGGSDEMADEPPTLLGDVVICPSVAARQAATLGRDVDDEIALLVVHGTLHLLEYDHGEPHEAAEMRRREQELLARFRDAEDRSGHRS